MIYKCPYCHKIQSKMKDLYKEYFNSSIFVCDYCKKEYLIDLNHQELHNIFWLNICNGIEMEKIPELYKDNEIAQKVYMKWMGKK